MAAATTKKIIKHLRTRDYFSKQIKVPSVNYKQCIDLIDWSFSDKDAKILCLLFLLFRERNPCMQFSFYVTI